MHKVLAVIVLALSLQGCYQVTNSWDISRSADFCRGVENIQEILVDVFGDEYVTCKDSSRKLLKDR